MPADLTVLDLETAAPVRPEEFRSKARFSPWAGERLHGWPVLTLVRGQAAFERTASALGGAGGRG